MNFRTKTTKLLAVLLLVNACTHVHAASFFDFFKRKPDTSQIPSAVTSLSGLTEVQMVDGLKEALGKGVQDAVASLGHAGGFLDNPEVRIPMPQDLQRVENVLRKLHQDALADEFVTTMNRAAEQAVPQAAGVLGDSVKQMSIADAKSILLGTNNAATQYFRRTSETNLHARFLPIVKAATEKAGVTSSYKRMTDMAGGALGGFGGFGESLLGLKAPDLDDYITSKTLDGLFLKIAEEEKMIRDNPVARTTELLQKVFGAVTR